jgi:hypothetical protein
MITPRALPTLGLLPAALAAAGQVLAGTASGLPWPSGAKSNLACLAQLRSRAIDVQHLDVAPKVDASGGPAGFANLVSATRGRVSETVASGPPVTLASYALLPYANKGQFAECAAGAFDGYWQQIGAALKAAAGTARTVIVEPGWEANLGSGVHPWGVDDASQLPAYKACFQHATAALRSAFPAVRIAWTNSKIYRLDYGVEQMAPGDRWFDYYGLMYYDNYRPLQSEATWDRHVDSHDGTGGSPSGIGSWLAYAKAHGKKLGVSEWGIRDRPDWDTATADDPVYIHDMFRFFVTNAAWIGWETYQNNDTTDTDGHQLCPTTPFPRARAMYAHDWQAG